jgi:hypothetical protein
MKYSIRGNIHTSDGSNIVDLLNDFTLWRLVTSESEGTFTFEAWLNNESDKTTLFNALKPSVDTHTGSIDWHECTHDEEVHQACVIAETYT